LRAYGEATSGGALPRGPRKTYQDIYIIKYFGVYLFFQININLVSGSGYAALHPGLLRRSLAMTAVEEGCSGYAALHPGLLRRSLAMTAVEEGCSGYAALHPGLLRRSLAMTAVEEGCSGYAMLHPGLLRRSLAMTVLGYATPIPSLNTLLKALFNKHIKISI
jgi:hypothetical protein